MLNIFFGSSKRVLVAKSKIQKRTIAASVRRAKKSIPWGKKVSKMYVSMREKSWLARGTMSAAYLA